MIDKQTLFILGAGASACSQYPTGEELNSFIINEFLSYKQRFLIDEEQELFEDHDIKNFTKLFDASRAPLIDYFIAKNPDEKIRGIGKLAIVLSILDGEIKNKNVKNIDLFDQDWFSIIFDKMTSDIFDAKIIDRILDNKISFITFNYDRSLEHSFCEALQSNYSLKNEKIKEILSSIKIIHTFGRFPALPIEAVPDHGFRYGVTPNLDFITKALEQIKTIHERPAASNEIAYELQIAERIFILGFGFADENLNLLRVFENIVQPKIYGTAYHWNKEKISITSKKLIPTRRKPTPSGGQMLISEPELYDMSCKQLLENYL